MSTSFKIFFGDSNIRRIRVESASPTYREFSSLLQDLYPENYHAELFVKWKDEDGDLITVSSEPEWQQMLQSVQERPIKLYVTEGLGPYFKDGPPPQPLFFYETDKEELKEDPKLLERLKDSVPKCLQHLFKGDTILPYDLPEWVKDAIQIKKLPLPGNEIDLDIDIPKLFDAMHKHALKLLSDAQNIPFLLQAKVILQDMLEIIPKHAVTLYNLSCAEALLGNTKEALAALRSAIVDGGYSNVEHLQKDDDLASLRDTPEFHDLVESMKGDSQSLEASAIMQDWENVGANEQKPIQTTQPESMAVEEQPVSFGEQKWNNSIQELKNMGFGKDMVYFGPRCVILLEKYNGDLNAVINELLQ